VWALYPDVIPALSKLRGKYRLGVISNFDGRLRTILDGLGIAHFFETIVLSSETGADKPHEWIFQRALADLRVQPYEAAHVGDDPVRDWQGAEAAGLHCFRLNRTENSLHDLPAFLAAKAIGP
jgi:putative hydrolase of the HAD superfamily